MEEVKYLTQKDKKEDQTDQKIAGCPSSIFVDVSATYNVGSHLVANSLDLQVGDLPTDNICRPI